MAGSKYTVVLLYPDWACDGASYGQEIYVAHIEAESNTEAVIRAKNQAADDQEHNIPAADFELCVMFSGWHAPEMFGWQQ